MCRDVATAQPQPDLQDALAVRMTPTMGRGVFACRAVPCGAGLGSFYTIEVPAAEVRAMAGGTLSRFWFEDEDGSAAVVLGIVELINHSTTPNVGRRWLSSPEGQVVQIFALRDIAAGEQLFIDYKFDGAPDDPPWSRAGA